MIQFLLNQELIQTEVHPATTLLDFIRYEQNLRGTKIGCREGDCGACTVLIGSKAADSVRYMSATSCLTPLANIHGKHVVTVEGVNLADGLNKVQQAMVQCSGTQCGFCTPGFVNSLSGYALTCQSPTAEEVISAIDGNICRCTGYKSIERAAAVVAQELQHKDTQKPLSWLVENKFIPDYFLEIPERLALISADVPANSGQLPVGGGTDLYVQKHDELHGLELDYLFHHPELNQIKVNGDQVTLGGSVTVTQLMEHPFLLERIPQWHRFLKLISSTPIRNIGTIAGNLANASPIGDFTAILLALNTQITLLDTQIQTSRNLPLRSFYLGYKTLDKAPSEIISQMTFEFPAQRLFYFDKVCKRQYLDIASVNTAISLQMSADQITEAHISMGGVGPTPLYLSATADYLIGKKLSVQTIRAAEAILQTELSPISDARGTQDYKRLLARQLFFGHFLSLFSDSLTMQELI